MWQQQQWMIRRILANDAPTVCEIAVDYCRAALRSVASKLNSNNVKNETFSFFLLPSAVAVAVAAKMMGVAINKTRNTLLSIGRGLQQQQFDFLLIFLFIERKIFTRLESDTRDCA